jgi:hypothetical protein
MDSVDNSALEERLTSIVRLIIDSPEAAKHGLLVTTKASNLSISDIRVVVASGDAQSAVFTLSRENRELRDEVRRLRGAKGFSWTDFIAACGDKVNIGKPKWRAIVAQHLDLTLGDLTAFERANRVPVVVLKQLEKMPDLREVVITNGRIRTSLIPIVNGLRRIGLPPRKIKQIISGLLSNYDGDETALHGLIDEHMATTQRAPARVWTEAEYKLGLNALRSRLGLPAVYAALPDATEGQINRKFCNDGPDETLLGPIVVADTGPMDYLELWKIGHALYGETWKKDVVRQYGMTRTAIQWDDPVWLDDVQRRQLRAAWREHLRSAPKSYPAFEQVALELAADPARDGKYVAWGKVFSMMRDRGVEVSNAHGPNFAARFNSERFELFDIKTHTKIAYQAQLALLDDDE